MTHEQRLKNLTFPTQKIDVVLDTDAYNEIDDQFATAYMLRSSDKLNVKAFYAAPFENPRSSGPADGMKKSYEEIKKLLVLAEAEQPVFKGSHRFLENETTPVISDAAKDLAERAKAYSPENPLCVVTIGAITNIASAMLLEPAVAENTVVVWLGGHARHFHDTKEFNMRQDIAAARVVMGSGVPFVQLPCFGVVSNFTVSGPELDHWFVGKNELADYLAANTVAEANSYAKGRAWSRVIWDVTAVAWLLEEKRFTLSKIVPVKLPGYDGLYEEHELEYPMCYVYHIIRDNLLNDMINKITK
jgi:inosine-uridine nucleoside N-ribohydrolase